MSYDTVFDVLDAGYRQWTFPAFGLILVAIGAAWAASGRSRAPEAAGRLKRRGPYVFLVFACVWTGVAFLSTYTEYRRMCQALETGRFVTVEGPVTGFVPMPATGRSMESFEVDGHRYRYSDFVVTAGFNNTQSHGGPIRDGLYVRIADVDGKIARLEIARTR
jgi:hypothetical protein